MKKCKKLLCLVLALVMALSLCTVAMAAETGATEPQLVGKITLPINNYEYGNIQTNATTDGFYVGDYLRYDTLGSTDGRHIGLETTYTYYKGDTAVDANKMTSPNNVLGTGKHTVVCTFKSTDTGYYLNAGTDDASTVVQYTVNGGDPTTSNCTVSYDENLKTLTATIVLDALTVVGGEVDYTFTKVVELGGDTEPGAKTFTLKQANVFSVVISNGVDRNETADPEVTVSGSVDTNGEGTYTGTLTISSNDKLQLKAFLEGEGELYVQEVNDNATGWTYDSQVWLVKSVSLREVTGESTDSTDIKVLAAKKVTPNENGGYTAADDAQWCRVEAMTFTNTYTENTTHEHTRRQPSTPTTPEAPVASPKTGDMGVALYAAMAVLSMSGSAVILGKKRSK